MENKIKIVFFATPDIALESFKFFINSPDYEVLALVTQKAKPQNRGKKIVERNITRLAKENNIKVFEPIKISKEPEIINELKSLNADFFITFAFGQILSQEVIDIPKFDIINLHASLLPLYRGANPICQCIEDGAKYTGITTMKTVLALDSGDICLQEKIEIPLEMNVIDLMEKISSLSPELLDKTLKGLYNNTLKAIRQDDSKATFTKKIKKEEKLIDWNMNAFDLHNKIRSMYKINTNHTFFNGKIVKVLKTIPLEATNCSCGMVEEVAKDGVIVGCKNGAIKLLVVKPEGKAEMQASAWACGARIKKGDCFTNG